jgi:hypothetical protein
MLILRSSNKLFQKASSASFMSETVKLKQAELFSLRQRQAREFLRMRRTRRKNEEEESFMKKALMALTFFFFFFLTVRAAKLLHESFFIKDVL